MKKKYILTFVCFVLLLGMTIQGQEVTNEELIKRLEQLEQKYQELQKQNEDQEQKLKEYEIIKQQAEEQKEELNILREQMASNEEETDERVSDLEDDVEEVLEETDVEVFEENTIGLLNKYIGNDIVSISGYYNFEFIADDIGNSPNRFRQHQLSLWVQKRIHNFNFFSEIEFEYTPSYEGLGATVKGQGQVKVESVWVEYLYHHMLNIRGGLMLIPDTRNVYHYPTTVVSINRPIHLYKVLPRDYVGVAVYGDTQDMLGESFGFAYQGFVSNGPGPNKGKDDPNENKVVGGKFTIHLPTFDFLDKFDTSGIIYYGKNETKDFDFIWNVEVLMEVHGLVLHMEYAKGRRNFNDRPGTNTRRSYGGFVEISYTFLDKYTVFGRGEIVDSDRRTINRERRLVAGMRYKPVPEISLKGEYFRHSHEDTAEEDYNGLALAITTLF